MIALYCAGRYEEVIELSSTINVRHLTTQLLLAGSYALVGQPENAKTTVANVLQENPGFSLGKWSENLSFSDSDDLKHYLAGLRKAGLPE